MDENGLTILGALEELKEDIRKMQEKHSDENRPMFFIDEGELELKLVAKKSGGAETGFKLYLFNNKIHGELSKESIQTLKIRFRAIGDASNTAAFIQNNTEQNPDLTPSTITPGSPTIGVDTRNLPSGGVNTSNLPK